MKTYKASEFARNPESVYEQARKEPVLIVRSRTNGEVKECFKLFIQSEPICTPEMIKS